MKKLILLQIFALTLSKIYAQDTINSIAYFFPQPVSSFEDRDTANYFYFDSTQSNNTWQIGTPSKTIFNNSFSAPLALMTDTINPYPISNTSSFEFVINSDDATSITFWHRFNSDSLADGGVIEVSTDGGSNWTNILNDLNFTLSNFYSSLDTISSNGNQPGFTGNSDWIQSIINGYALNYYRFRFTFTSDSLNTNKEGWMIDDFNFQCFGTGLNDSNLNSPIQVFPNPTSDYIFIHPDQNVKFKSAIVREIAGKTLLSTGKTTVDLSSFPAGIYSIEISTDAGTFLRQVFRQ